jgi:uncharacterized membrane protein
MASVGRLKGSFLDLGAKLRGPGDYWVGNHFQFHFVPKVDRGFRWLNLLFLLVITLLPFSTNLLGGSHDLHIPIVIYGINVLLLSLILLVSLRYLRQRPELCHEGLTPSLVADSYRRLLLVALGCAASIAISFYSPGIAVWLLLAVHFLVARRQHV